VKSRLESDDPLVAKIIKKLITSQLNNKNNLYVIVISRGAVDIIDHCGSAVMIMRSRLIRLRLTSCIQFLTTDKLFSLSY
jgi:hypothetical protein